MEAVVLAAGAGTRMRPLTLTCPKALLPVGGRPLVLHVLDRAVEAGATKLHLVVHHGAGMIRKSVGSGHQGVAVTFHEQGDARGTGHAVASLDPAPREPFLLLSADTLVGSADLKRLVKAAGQDNGLVVGAHRADDPRAYGALETRDAQLVHIHEKSDEPPSDLVNTGTYLFPPSIMDAVKKLKPSSRGEIELTDAVNAHAAQGNANVVEMETWIDVGRPWDLLRANRAVLEAKREDAGYWVQEGFVGAGVQLEGPVRVEEGARVEAGSVIEGPVVVQADARVGPLAYVRAHSVIGEGCHVGAHTEIKNSLLFAGANAPHLNYVGDSILGARVNLGAGTVIANLRHDDANVPVTVAAKERLDSGRRKLGAILGDDVKTGINVSLDCGTVVGAGALLAPGETYRSLLEGDRIHYGHGKSGPKKHKGAPSGR